MENQMHGAMPGTATSQTSHDDTGKRSATLTARFVIAGIQLVPCNPPTGAALYHLIGWGLVKPFADLDVAEAFLLEIGGAT